MFILALHKEPRQHLMADLYTSEGRRNSDPPVSQRTNRSYVTLHMYLDSQRLPQSAVTWTHGRGVVSPWQGQNKRQGRGEARGARCGPSSPVTPIICLRRTGRSHMVVLGLVNYGTTLHRTHPALHSRGNVRKPQKNSVLNPAERTCWSNNNLYSHTHTHTLS